MHENVKTEIGNERRDRERGRRERGKEEGGREGEGQRKNILDQS